MFQTLHEISKNLIFVFVWKYVWKYVNINVSDITGKKNLFSVNFGTGQWQGLYTPPHAPHSWLSSDD